MKRHCADCTASLPVMQGRGRRPTRCASCQKRRRSAADTASKRARYASDETYRQAQRDKAARRAGLFFHATQ